MGATATALVRATRRHVVRQFDVAVQQTQLDVRKLPVPVDTARLRKGIRVRPLAARGDVLRAEVTSTTRSPERFDYPAFINTAVRIVPRKRKYLRWVDQGGQPVFSKGFTNPNRNWWPKFVKRTGPVWRKAIRKAYR